MDQSLLPKCLFLIALAKEGGGSLGTNGFQPLPTPPPPKLAPVLQIKSNYLGTFLSVTKQFQQKGRWLFKFPKGRTAFSPVLQAWLGLVSSRNVSLWCYNLKDGGPFDPSPGFVGYRVFVNRKHSCTSGGAEIKAHTSPSFTYEPLPFTSNTCRERRLNY